MRVRDESRTRTATGIPLASVVETLARRRVGPAEGHTGRMAARIVARQFSRGHPIVTLMLELSRCDRRIESRHRRRGGVGRTGRGRGRSLGAQR